MAEDQSRADALQTRAVGEQLFSIWEAKQDRKSKLQGSLPAWAACALSVGTVLWQAAITSGNVEDNTRRVEQVEIELRSQQQDDRVVIERLARIEAKLDLISDVKLERSGGR